MTLTVRRLPSDIMADFYKFYHDPKLTVMTQGILSLLKNDFDEMANVNQHYKWLDYTIRQVEKNHKDDPFAELQGMMYGMIYTAFEKLLGDYTRFVKADSPDFFRRKLEWRDAFAYLCEACDQMFADPFGGTKVVRVNDILSLLANVIVENENLRIYVTDITPEIVADILNIAESDGAKSHIEPFKERMKVEIKKYLEEHNAKAGRK